MGIRGLREGGQRERDQGQAVAWEPLLESIHRVFYLLISLWMLCYSFF